MKRLTLTLPPLTDWQLRHMRTSAPTPKAQAAIDRAVAKIMKKKPAS